MQQPNRYCTGGSQAGTGGWNVAHGAYFYFMGDTSLAQTLSHQLMLQIVNVGDHLRPRIAYAYHVIVAFFDDHVDVLVDSGTEDASVFLGVELGEISPTT